MTTNPPDGYAADDFLEQILSIPSYTGLAGADSGNSSETASLNHSVSHLGSAASVGSGMQHHTLFPLGLSLDNGHGAEREAVNNNIGSLYPAFDHLQGHAIRHPVPQVQQALQGQFTLSTAVTVRHAPGIRPRVQSRRGQATDSHSSAEWLCRESISEQIKALQELVPSCKMTDKAACHA